MVLEYRKKIQIEFLKGFTEQTKHVLENQEEQDFGLSIAKEILDRNGGRIDIRSIVGKGTEVVIRIPTKREEKEKDVE